MRGVIDLYSEVNFGALNLAKRKPLIQCTESINIQIGRFKIVLDSVEGTIDS